MIATSEKLLLVLIYLVILNNKNPEANSYNYQKDEYDLLCDVNFGCKNPNLICFFGKCVCPAGFK